MDCDLISVIVPVYNVERYLEKCIESICSQTFQNLEIILSDDGSTDSSGAICDRWVHRDSRIRVIHKENGGLSDARNAGIEIASGKWFMFVDSDDTITPDTVDRLYSASMEHSCEIAVCNMVRIYDDGSTEPFYNPVDALTVWPGQQRFETLKQPSVCNKLFRAELFEDLRFPQGKLYEDTFVYHVLAHRAGRIALTGHDGYYYLSRRESILGQPKYTDRYFDRIEAVYERVRYLIDHQVAHYAEEACESLYAAVRLGSQYITPTAENCEKFENMWQWYDVAYRHLMGHRATSVKMKLRLVLLKYAPRLHNKIY